MPYVTYDMRLLRTSSFQHAVTSIFRTSDGSTSLHMEANQGHATVIKKLLVAQCTVDLQAKNGATPLYVVVGKGHEAVTKQLIELDVTSIFRTTMGARRSTSRYSEGMTQSRSS